MILLIDNYDSFVYNLARYLTELGASTVVYRNDAITLADIDAMQPSHIVISPGPCTPSEAGISLAAITHSMGKMPLLGVCLGHQAIAQACGGKVVRGTPCHGKAAQIFHNAEGIFEGLPLALTVGRYHSLVVEEQTLPQDLFVTARTKNNEIMALAHRKYPVFGVQFHPESILTECGYLLLQRFLSYA